MMSYIIEKHDANCVWIIDDNKGMSITNSAERVVEELFKRYGDRRIIYRDTMGSWDELKHRGAVFTGFWPAGELAL